MWSGWVVCLSEVLGALALVGLSGRLCEHGKSGVTGSPLSAHPLARVHQSTHQRTIWGDIWVRVDLRTYRLNLVSPQP